MTPSLNQDPIGNLPDTACELGHLVPGASVEVASAGLRRDPSDLFEEERDVLPGAAVAQVTDPVEVDGPMAGAALSSGDDPVDAGQVEGRQWAKGLRRNYAAVVQVVVP